MSEPSFLYTFQGPYGLGSRPVGVIDKYVCPQPKEETGGRLVGQFADRCWLGAYTSIGMVVSDAPATITEDQNTYPTAEEAFEALKAKCNKLITEIIPQEIQHFQHHQRLGGRDQSYITARRQNAVHTLPLFLKDARAELLLKGFVRNA